MKVSVPRRLSLDEMQGDWKDARETLVSSLGDFQDGTVQLLNGNLSSENTTSTHREVTLKHGVETRIRNPLGVTPVGVYAVKCVGIEIGSDGRPTRKLYSLSTPRIDWRTAGENLLITANYDLRHTEPCLILTNSATQSINNTTNTVITGWDTTAKSRGSVISVASGVFTVTEAGTYDVSLQTRLQGGVTYNQAQASIRQGGVILWDHYIGASMTDEPEINISGPLILAASGTFETMIYQGNAAAAARTFSIGCRVAVQRRYNDSTPFGRVTLYFFGG